MLSTLGNLIKTDRRLFRQEIRASIAHCNGLFRAGILTRLETERLKNGLWTILKRADFDRNFYEALPTVDVFSFVETKLFHLINEAAASLRIGRSREVQAVVALRLWLREELENLCEALDNLIEILNSKTEKPFFAAYSESFLRDHQRFREVLERTNKMPIMQFTPADDSIAELDFAGIAHELEFPALLENAIDSVNDRDFAVEFASAAALTMLHAANLANEMLNSSTADTARRELLEAARGKSATVFGNHAALLVLLKNLTTNAPGDLDQVCPIVFDTMDALKINLQIVTASLDN